MIIDHLWFFFCQVPINVFVYFFIGMFLFFNLRVLYILRKSALTVIHIICSSYITSITFLDSLLPLFSLIQEILPQAPANAHLKDLDGEIFDDDDFYHQV